MTFGTNLLLAVLWAALIGPFTPVNLLFGFGVGYVALRLCNVNKDDRGYVRRAIATAMLALYTIYELVMANVRVAWQTVAPLGGLRPAILRVPLEPGMTDIEITLLSTLITLTPGTLTMDLSDEGDALFIHFMHVDDVDEAIDAIKRGFERRILEVTR